MLAGWGGFLMWQGCHVVVVLPVSCLLLLGYGEVPCKCCAPCWQSGSCHLPLAALRTMHTPCCVMT